jgi:hypothetical protein
MLQTMRLMRFIIELRLMLQLGWSVKPAIGNAWRRSHPQARERFEAWLKAHFHDA